MVVYRLIKYYVSFTHPSRGRRLSGQKAPSSYSVQTAQCPLEPSQSGPPSPACPIRHTSHCELKSLHFLFISPTTEAPSHWEAFPNEVNVLSFPLIWLPPPWPLFDLDFFMRPSPARALIVTAVKGLCSFAVGVFFFFCIIL